MTIAEPLTVDHKPPLLDRIATLCAWVVLLLFVVASMALARRNQSPGSPDSCANLILGRNLAQGKEYAVGGLGELWIKRPLDAVDSIRPPGLPYLLAAIFALGGVSLAVPVLVNSAAIGINALALRAAIRRMGGRWAGDLALILILLSTNYELVSIINNNILAACMALLLLLATWRLGPETKARGSFGFPVLLALVSAFGFLMKQTFVLSACPFALLVLGSNTSKAVSRRVLEMSLYLGLLVALTSVYWGPNLLRHGEVFHVPALASSRLAARYEILPNGPARTLRFDRPMDYGEVIRTIGLPKMLLIDAKQLAKTIFYTICMNPAVMLCASAVLLFGRVARWRDYAVVASLCGGIVFEVGIYNHHEFRYLWPMYPCLIFLASLTVRDYQEWGQTQLSPCLQWRFRLAFLLLGASALLIGVLGGLENWRVAAGVARQPMPGWVGAVQQLPPSSVILTSEVGPVIWWTGRRAVITPLGSRDDLAVVIAAYQPGYYLGVGDEDLHGRKIAFLDRDLTLIERGQGWSLYRIVGPDGSALLQERPDPLLRIVPQRVVGHHLDGASIRLILGEIVQLVKGAFAQREDPRAGGEDGVDERLHGRVKLVCGDDRVDQAQLSRPIGSDGVSRQQHFQARLGRQGANQGDHRRGAEEADLHARRGEGRPTGRNGQVAGRHELTPGGRGHALHPGDHRLGQST